MKKSLNKSITKILSDLYNIKTIQQYKGLKAQDYCLQLKAEYPDVFSVSVDQRENTAMISVKEGQLKTVFDLLKFNEHKLY